MIPQAFINEWQQLKVEINTREHFAVLGLTKKVFEVKSLWFSQQAMTTTFHLEELLATKLRALFQRKKGRDLFDLVVILKKFPDLDIEKMLQSFKQYMAFDQTKVSRAEFEANLAEKLNDEAFVKDIFPLLPSSIATGYQSSLDAAPYHPLNDVIHVQERIINRLPGGGWKGRDAANYQIE
jgi:hypothetical protein